MHGTRAALTTIVFHGDYIHADISDRETAEETRTFLRSIAAAADQYKCRRILVSVRSSRPMFKVEDYDITTYFKQLAANPNARVALLSDSDEGRVSHEYIVVLARQYGAGVRSFRSEADAVAWLVAD